MIKMKRRRKSSHLFLKRRKKFSNFQEEEDNEKYKNNNNNDNDSKIVVDSSSLENMDAQQKVDRFNELVNSDDDNKYEIKVQNFYNLTCGIKDVDENQFNFMIGYYNHLQSKGDSESQIVFNNLDKVTDEMLPKLLELNGFSIEFLSKTVQDKIIERVRLYDKEFKNIEKIHLLNEDVLNNEEEFAKNSAKRFEKIKTTFLFN